MKKLLNGVLVDVTPEEIENRAASRKEYESSPLFKIQKIEELKERLFATDYKAIKFAEGWLTEEEYAPIRAERQSIREQINSLEAEL